MTNYGPWVGLNDLGNVFNMNSCIEAVGKDYFFSGQAGSCEWISVAAYREVIEPEVDHATSTHKMYWHHKVRQAYNIPFIGLSCGKLFAITIQGDSIKAEWVE